MLDSFLKGNCTFISDLVSVRIGMKYIYIYIYGLLKLMFGRPVDTGTIVRGNKDGINKEIIILCTLGNRLCKSCFEMGWL